MDRRRFLGASAAASLALALRPMRSGAATGARGVSREGCALLDLGDGCALRESLAGWTATGATVVRGDASELADRALLVLPGACAISPALAGALLHHARGGASVVIESGALFADDASFAEHRDALRAGLDVDIASPVSLWPRRHGGVPYVEYFWPSAARVRDFSRALPLLPGRGDEIAARVDAIPVAVTRRVGAGRLVVLGSPLGPALGAGDAEARSWLAGLLGRASGRT